ncbi:hypothetical protein V4C53_30200 [Paraburkholderia azotifigens]|uniref:hypothetical protein n=1 Tax=Paraburkholderia azotifigens TaxID=2057004 RepID=UPI003180AE24
MKQPYDRQAVLDQLAYVEEGNFEFADDSPKTAAFAWVLIQMNSDAIKEAARVARAIICSDIADRLPA